VGSAGSDELSSLSKSELAQKYVGTVIWQSGARSPKDVLKNGSLTSGENGPACFGRVICGALKMHGKEEEQQLQTS
jgi:hypothetical protein